MTQPYRFLPRSILDRGYWTELTREPRHLDVVAAVSHVVEMAQDVPPVVHATDYLAAKRANNRRPIDAYWQLVGPTLGALAVNRAIRGIDPSDPDDRLLNWLFAITTQATWERSAHLPGFDLPPPDRPQQDLTGCDVAVQLAEMVEVLGPWMDSISTTLKAIVLAEIDRRVLTPFELDSNPWWLDEANPHVSNWMGVTAGCLLGVCESLAAIGQPRPVARSRAIRLLRRFFDHGFTPDGECDEGVGYWGYGVGMACVGLSRLTPEELASAIDMDRFRRVASYPQRAHLGGNNFYAANDASTRAGAGRSFVPWLAAATGIQWLNLWTAAYPSRRSPERFHGLLRSLAVPADLPSGAIPLPPRKPRLLTDQQAGIFRVDTAVGEIIAILSGGHNGERHNHNDVGHFSVLVDGEEMVPDMGVPAYTPSFFGPQRYMHLAASSRGHNCPVINDYEQRPGRAAAASIAHWRPENESPSLKLDCTAAYPAEAGLLRWTREMTADPAAVRIVDDFSVGGPASRIGHVIWSTVEPTVAGPDLRLGKLKCELSPPPTTLTVTPVPPAEHEIKQSNATLYRIDATYLTKQDQPAKITTLFTLGG